MKARHSLEQQAKGAIGKNPATSGGCVIPGGVCMGSQVWPPASPLHVHWGSSTTPHTLTMHPKLAPREQKGRQDPSRGWQQLARRPFSSEGRMGERGAALARRGCALVIRKLAPH